MPPYAQAQQHLNNANQLAQQKKFNAAFSEFEKAIRRDYRNPKAHSDFGAALLEAGRFPKAVEQFRKAIECDPAAPLDSEQLVKALLHDVHLERDLKELQKIVDKADRADLFHTWAQVLARLQHSDRAIKAFKSALKKNPELELEIGTLVQAFNASNPSEAQIKRFQDFIDTLNNGPAWNTWGKTLLDLGRYAVAAEQFEKAASVKKDWAEPYINHGRALTELGDYRQAINIFREAVKNDGNCTDVYFHLAEALNQIGDHKQAVSNYERAAEKGPSGAHFGPWLESLKQLKNPDVAIKKYQQALTKNNSTSSLHFHFGKFLRERGRLSNSAIQFAQSLLSAEPPFYGRYKAASQLRDALSDITNSKTTLDKIEEIFDKHDNPYGHLQFGRVLAEMDDVDRAKSQLSEVLAHLPNMPELLDSIKDLVLAFKSAKNRYIAQDQIEEAVSKLNNSELEVQWARVLHEDLDNLEQALTLYRKVLLAAPTTPGLVEGFAKALEDTANPTSVLENIQDAVNDAADAAVFYHWALILITLGREKSAVEALQEAIRLKHDHTDAHYQLALLYGQQRNYTKAYREFQRTVEFNHDSWTVFENWGTTLLKAGRREEAIQKYLQAVKMRGTVLDIPDSFTWNNEDVAQFQKVVDEVHTAEIYQTWGRLLRNIKRPELAIQQFKTAVVLDPDIPDDSYSEWLKAIATLGFPPDQLQHYEETIGKYRDNATAYYKLADLLYRLKRYEQAAEKTKQALERDPKDFKARRLSIQYLGDTNNIFQAKKEAELLLQDYPLSAFACESLSLIAFIRRDYAEAIRQAERGIETGNGLPVSYYRCAWALFKSGQEELALKKFDEALEEDPYNFDIHHQRGRMLMGMNRYDEAADAHQKVVKLKADHAYAHHNLAAIAYSQGQYEDAWKYVTSAIKLYEQQTPLLARVIDEGAFVDGYEPYDHASLVMAFRPNQHQQAENILKQGHEFDRYHRGILRGLAEVNWEKKEEFTGLNSEDSRRKSESYWNAMQHFYQAEKLLNEQLKLYRNYDLLIELGELYLTHEDYEKARACFEEARSKDDDKASLPFARLGLINLRDRQYDKAIQSLQDALKRNPDDLDVKSNLAEAYLRSEKLDDAETTYRQVLNIAQNHVQSYIGLGEICNALGDKKDSDRYCEAIEHFTRALDIAANEKIRSKYLKKQEKATVHYQLGYARVQLYESSGIRRDVNLLKDAQKDFANCIDLGLNRSYEKAKRAKEKIDKRLGYFSRDWLTETAGPIAIAAMSLGICVAIQFLFFVMPLFNRPSFIVSNKSLQAVAEHASAEALQSLATLRNQKFSSRDALADAVRPLLKENVEKVTGAVFQNAEAVKPFEHVPELDGGYYALLTFGSLLFMVVGLYLPQILKLRVAGIELEKSSVEPATGTLGISKLG